MVLTRLRRLGPSPVTPGLRRHAFGIAMLFRVALASLSPSTLMLQETPPGGRSCLPAFTLGAATAPALKASFPVGAFSSAGCLRGWVAPLSPELPHTLDVNQYTAAIFQRVTAPRYAPRLLMT